MTKVMDLFRHRSNSAMSDADKRKAVSNRKFIQKSLRFVAFNINANSYTSNVPHQLVNFHLKSFE